MSDLRKHIPDLQTELSRRDLLLAGLALPLAGGLLHADGRSIAAAGGGTGSDSGEVRAAAPAVHVVRDKLFTPDMAPQYGVAADWPQCYPWVDGRTGGIVDMPYMRGEQVGRYVNGTEYLSRGELRIYHSGDISINDHHRRAGTTELVVAFVQGDIDTKVRSEGGWTGLINTGGNDIDWVTHRAFVAGRLQRVIENKGDVSAVHLMDFNGNDGDIEIDIKRLGRREIDDIIAATPDRCLT